MVLLLWIHGDFHEVDANAKQIISHSIKLTLSGPGCLHAINRYSISPQAKTQLFQNCLSHIGWKKQQVNRMSVLVCQLAASPRRCTAHMSAAISKCVHSSPHSSHMEEYVQPHIQREKLFSGCVVPTKYQPICTHSLTMRSTISHVCGDSNISPNRIISLVQHIRLQIKINTTFGQSCQYAQIVNSQLVCVKSEYTK